MDSILDKTRSCLKNGRPSFLQFFHLSVAFMYLAGIWGYYDFPCRYPIEDSPALYAGFWKFLTYWNLIAQFLFFFFSCITDYSQAFESHPIAYDRMIKFRDIVYASVIFPYGAFVTAMFWALHIYEPQFLDGQFPAWLNHISHSVELPVLLVESFLINHRYPSKTVGLTWTMTFGGTYLLWTLFLAFGKGIWVYPILEILPWYGKAIFIFLSFVLQMIIYLVSEIINSLFWRYRSSALKELSNIKKCKRMQD